MYGSLTTEAKSACSAASRAAFKAVTISMGDRAGAVMVKFPSPPLNIIITFIYWGCLSATLAGRETIKMSEPEGGL